MSENKYEYIAVTAEILERKDTIYARDMMDALQIAEYKAKQWKPSAKIVSLTNLDAPRRYATTI